MNCPICGESNPENALYCIHCGNALPQPEPVAEPLTEPVTEPAPPPVYGTHRVPILIMAALVLLGLVLFLLTTESLPLTSGDVSELFFVQGVQ